MKKKFMAALVMVLAVGVIFTVVSTKLSQKPQEDEIEVMTLLSGWKKNVETDHKMTIYGVYLLSTDLDSDISHDYYCATDDCYFVVGNDNYAIIYDNGYLIYSVIDSTFIPIDTKYDLETVQMIVNDGILYGMVFRNNDNDFYYDLNTKDYYLINNDCIIDYDTRYVINKNLILHEKDNKYYLYDFIKDEIIIEAPFIELNYLEVANDYYLVTYDKNNKSLAVYNSKLQKVDAINTKNITMYNNLFVMTYDNKTFVVKNTSGEIVKTSISYDNIKEFVGGYVIALKNDNIVVVNINDEIVKEIPLNGRDYVSVRGELDDNYGEAIYFYFDDGEEEVESFFNPNTFEYSEKTY